MNKRLLAYLRKLGLAADATDDQAWEFYRALRGAQASIANALNYAEGDEAARTTCDLMIRAAGFDPADPVSLLVADPQHDPQRQQTPAPAVPQPGGDGASTAGDLERARLEGEQRAIARINAIRELGEMVGAAPTLISELERDLTITADAARQRIRDDWRARTAAAQVNPDLPSAGPAIHSRSSQTDFSVDALRCALLMQSGIDDPATVTRWFTPDGALVTSRTQGDALQRARDRGDELLGLAPRVVMQRALALDGIRVEPTVQGIVGGLRSAAAMSTSSLVNITTQTFGARLLRSWMETEDTTEGWVDVEENPNYLANQRVRVGMVEGLAHVPRGAEAEDITIADETAYTKVYRYGRKAIFDEMDIQNDRWGVITGDIPRLMGEAARRLRPDLVYAILLANPTMADGVALFHASHGNTAAATFGESALESAYQAMSVQRIGGVSVNVRPWGVIHPWAMDFTVDKLLNPNAVLIGNTTADQPRVNYVAVGRRGLQHRADARLDNGVVDPKTGTTYAGDLTDWYLVGQGPAPIVVSYLEGNRRAPAFRSGVLSQGSFGLWFDAQMSIGATATEYRTIFRRTAA